MKASEAYLKCEFHTVHIKGNSDGSREIEVLTWDGKRGKCVIRTREDGSIEILYDEDLR